MLRLTFIIAEGKAEIKDRGTGAAACVIAFDGTLCVKAYYSFSAVPLVLGSDAQTGDEAEIRFYPFRIELYLNGVLCDEEWPCGKAFTNADCFAEGDFEVRIDAVGDGESPPAVLRKNLTADEIRRCGVNIGDCMPFSDAENDGRYHLFYLYDRHHHGSKWGLGAHQWAHIATKDFITWDEYPAAVPITDEREGSICTGSVCRGKDENGKTAYYAWYAVRTCDRSPARIGYAVSYDLIRFEKCGSYFVMPAGYEPSSARDPKVFEAGGKYHMFVTTSRMNDNTGCLAHLVNDRMSADGWKDAGIVLSCEELYGGGENASVQPECPDYFKMGDYYYLVFGIGGTGYYVFSKDPYGGWIFPRKTVPCGNVPKSALLPGTGRRIFCGFVCEGGYGGGLCAAEAFSQSNGRLEFSSIDLHGKEK